MRVEIGVKNYDECNAPLLYVTNTWLLVVLDQAFAQP